MLMPIVDVTLLVGRSTERKTALIKALTETVVETLEAPPQTVRVILREVSPSHYAVGGKLKSETSDAP